MKKKSALIICVIIVFVFSVMIIENFKQSTAEQTNSDIEKIENKVDSIIKNNSGDIKKYFLTQKEIKIPVLLYHEFTEEIPDKEKYYIISTPERFEENIVTLIENGYTIISLDDAYRYSRNKKAIPEKSVVITLDDGYLSNYTMIYPILKKYNVPATIFIVTGSMDYKNHFDWEQAKEMESSGLVSIYSHCDNHINYNDVEPERFTEDIIVAHNKIIKNLGKRNFKIFCYPGGEFDKSTNIILDDFDYDLIMTTISGVNTVKDFENKLLKRQYVYYNYTPEQLVDLLK